MQFMVDCLQLFSDTLSACQGIPILNHFLCVPLFLGVVNIAAMLVRLGREGKL